MPWRAAGRGREGLRSVRDRPLRSVKSCPGCGLQTVAPPRIVIVAAGCLRVRPLKMSLGGEVMREELLSLLAARKGHFRYESGHHGDLWLEIPRLYLRPSRLRRFAAALARRLAPHGIEAVCGPLIEGALLAQMVAEELDVAFSFAEQFAHSRGDSLYPLGYR